MFATKGNDLELVNWVIQCKCYAPSRKVDRSVVHELVGVLAEYPHGTRGMVVTTSDFSADARKTAATAGVRLMSDAEFATITGAIDDAAEN